MVPGEIFYLFGQLDAQALRDARASDAFGTLTVAFDQPELVRSLSVPEPSTLVLLGIGCVALTIIAACSRRQSPCSDIRTFQE